MANSVLKANQEVIEKLLADAEKVGILAFEEAVEAEKNATFSEKVINAFKETEIPKLLLPQKYGGPQIDFKTYTKIIRAVAKHSISAAWLTYFYPLHNTLLAFLPEKGREEIIRQGGLVADVFAPIGKAVRDGEGYRITGTYNFASGVLYADWVGLGLMMEMSESVGPEFCMFILPKSDVKIVENWNTLGLRATGSNQVIADNVFVPFERIVRLTVANTTGRPPEKDYDKDYLFYDLPYFSAFYVGFASIALGGAERLLEEFKKRTEKRVRIEGELEKESPRSQRVLAELTTKFYTAEGLMEKYISMLENYQWDGGVGPEEFFAIRAKIISIVTEITTKVLTTLGGAAVYKGDTVEQFTRDLLTVATHKVLLYEDSIDAFGKTLFGFETFTLG
ncbi:acyl-CoA dehydrogenase [Neobacillus drentensis]|uniref:acyl-CoA dehydrogenase n=1 Tax=Neobacillus drentensis TaxID=220684 RepID=UPI002FFF69D3